MKNKLKFKSGDIIRRKGNLFDNCSLATYYVDWAWTDSNLYGLRRLPSAFQSTQSYDSRWVDKNYERVGHEGIGL